MAKAKAIVLLSGGLDSRLAVKLLQEQGIKVIALHFLLPFSGCCKPDCAFNFAQMQGIALKIVDCTKGKNFDEYINVIRKPKYGYGSGINPCIDCRIFMLCKAKDYVKKTKADFVATGEVLNERPMSQHGKALAIAEKESGLKGKLLRPLSAKLLPETEVEKKKLVDRSKLLAIRGRSRKQQIALAKKYNIKYPSPAGGCLLCEKEFAAKFKDLFKHKKRISPADMGLLRIGRHFRINDTKIIVGRNEKENKQLLKLAKKIDTLIEVKDAPSPITLMQGNGNDKIKKAAALTIRYSDVNEGIVRYGKGKLSKELKSKALSNKEIDKLRIGKRKK